MSGARMKTFNGEKLRSFLQKRGLDCQTLAQMVKKDDSYISRAINTNRINESVYELMCIKLDVDSDYFNIIETEPQTETDHTVAELLEENNRLLRELISIWRAS